MVLAAILMVLLLAFVAFAVDLGYIMLAKTQLQVAADAAALAAASSMGDRDELIDNAQEIGELNYVGGTAVKIQSADVVIGTWDPNQSNPSDRFTPLADQSQPGNRRIAGMHTNCDSRTILADCPMRLGSIREHRRPLAVALNRQRDRSIKQIHRRAIAPLGVPAQKRDGLCITIAP